MIINRWELIALYVNNNYVTYCDSFGVEHISRQIKKFIGNKNAKTNIYRIQAYDSIMCRYFCIEFIDLMLKKVCWIIRIYFLQMIMRRMIK